MTDPSAAGPRGDRRRCSALGAPAEFVVDERQHFVGAGRPDAVVDFFAVLPRRFAAPVQQAAQPDRDLAAELLNNGRYAETDGVL